MALVLLTACNGRCGHDPSDSVRVDASATASAAPSSSVVTVVAEDANAPTDSGFDAGCLSAHDDALARYLKFCADEPSCHPAEPNEDPIGVGSKAPDLDGDGIGEIIWGWGPIPVNTESHLYRGFRGAPGCAVHLASLGGSETIKPQSARHEGYRDIVTEDYGICEGASGGCTPVIDGYVFQAGQYQLDPKRHVDGTAKLTPDQTN